MHARNRHQGRYDFAQLVRISPGLASHVRPTPRGDDSIDFADPVAVTALNRAILQACYGISQWDIPAGYLCPAIPGRADYVHYLADLLAAGNDGTVPRGASVRVLDIGTGASCIYPIIGVHDYGWSFVGTEIDPRALQSAQDLVAAHPSLAGRVECRRQTSAKSIFEGIFRRGERFDASMCNPPFHASAEAAAAGTRRKLRNLGQSRSGSKSILNFGGQSHELWCRGGEAVFIRRMITESVRHADACRWFSTLVSKRENLPAILRHLDAVGVNAFRTIDLAQGQKHSRVIAWTYGPAVPDHGRGRRATVPLRPAYKR